MAVSIHDRPDTPPADVETLVVECSQWVGLHGLTLSQALGIPETWDKPRVVSVREGQNCPWGHSWYRENRDTGKLELWRYNWDSSG